MTALSKRGQTTAELTRGMAAVAAEFGFRPVRSREFPTARKLAAHLMAHEVSTSRTFRAVQAIQPAASLCFLEGGQITGVNGILLLREAAVAPLKAGRFDGVEVDLDLLSRPDEVPAIGYGWGMAGSSKPAGTAITRMSQAFRAGPLASLTFITKAVTGAGRHVSITRFGYRPLRGPDDDLLINEPVASAPPQERPGLVDARPEGPVRSLSQKETQGVD